MREWIEGQCYKLGALCFVARKLKGDLWALYLREEPESPALLMCDGLFFRAPFVPRVIERYTPEDLEEIWTLEEVFEAEH